MPALNAIRLNPEFKAEYEAMIKAGKPAKVAIVAITRKLLILANALIRNQLKWPPPSLDRRDTTGSEDARQLTRVRLYRTAVDEDDQHHRRDYDDQSGKENYGDHHSLSRVSSRTS
jgi:hypothetical protein